MNIKDCTEMATGQKYIKIMSGRRYRFNAHNIIKPKAKITPKQINKQK